MTEPMRTLVFAYHNVGHACLQVLIDQEVEVIGVVTHKDDPQEEIWFQSVTDLAHAKGIPVHTPPSVGTGEFARWTASLKPDLIFSFYYRNLLPPEVLKIPPLGAMNLHGSYLPKYRGRSPVNWVLVRGERETGVTLHYMETRADAGDIVGRKKVPIDPDETARQLFDKITLAAAELLRELLPLIQQGRAPRIPQNHQEASYFGGRRPEDGAIDWHRSAREIYNLVRAVAHPYPGASTHFEGRKVLVWDARPEQGQAAGEPGEVLSVSPLRVAAAEGRLRLLRLQPEGDNEMDPETFTRKYGLKAGSHLGS
jgi:methionyl-tRNA formyltransferase